jgi:hypothetical protein
MVLLRGDKIWPDSKKPYDPFGFESDPILFFLKVKLIRIWFDPNPNDLKSKITEIRQPETLPDPNPNDPKIWDDPRTDNLKPDPIRTWMTENLRWPEIKWPETQPDPNPNNSKPEMTRN